MKIAIIESSRNVLNLVMAAARTCYSKKPVLPTDVEIDRMSGFCLDLFKAGHHTVFQHPQYTFLIEGVSRYLVWDLLHRFPFYNSEQTSQRYTYTETTDGYAILPKTDNRDLFERTFHRCGIAYKQIVEELVLSGRKKKEAQEDARYVLPIATETNLYYTVNLMTVFRIFYSKFIRDLTKEEEDFIENIKECVCSKDPLLSPIFEYIEQNENLEADEPLFDFDNEEKAFQVAAEKLLDGKSSFLKQYSVGLSDNIDILFDVKDRFYNTDNPDAFLAGIEKSESLASRLFESVLQPTEKEPLPGLSFGVKPCSWSLNDTFLSYINAVSFVADCQEQRHRTVSHCSPMLKNTFVYHSDKKYYIPAQIERCSSALKIYSKTMDELYSDIYKEMDAGRHWKEYTYLLPNCHMFYNIESGSLPAFQMKFMSRLCNNAQKETHDLNVCQMNCLDSVFSRKGTDASKCFGPQCVFRKNLEIVCPEGVRSCKNRVNGGRSI